MEEELDYYKKFVSHFFKAMRTSSDADIQQIIDLMRSGSSTSEVQSKVAYIIEENRYTSPTSLQKAPEWDQGD
jgi:hypothetical protein